MQPIKPETGRSCKLQTKNPFPRKQSRRGAAIMPQTALGKSLSFGDNLGVLKIPNIKISPGHLFDSTRVY